MNTTADEIVDLRIWPLEASDRWGVRYHFKNGYVHIAPAGSLSNAIAMAARLRRPPAFRVIEGGRTAPTTSATRPEFRLTLIAG
ncbi:MAG TPA: hypothetical protein VFB68_16610 [Xanthobacteraceae bacterium]|nr:hypothetical protein [Xanthobacteraceae bacterium]